MKTKKTIDISKRFEMVNAERNMYDRNTKYYKQLTEVIKFILNEYGGDQRGIKARYFFVMDSNGYRLINLTDCGNYINL